MSKGIFDGLRVCDFMWAAAGPITTKQLSDNGATVVKVESFKHPDSVRLGGPFIDNKPGINRSGFFVDFHSSKLGMAVDMSHEDRMDIIRPLIEWADIVTESFRPGIMAKWGVDYESLKKINPRIIMLSSSLHGATGPWSRHPGYGTQGAALAGIQHMTGWPDRPPATPKGAYSDSVSPRYSLSALMAALIHRERTGEGQWVELSQVESTVQLVAPQLLDLQITGREALRAGNSKDGALQHGVYPCTGKERWIVIECENEDHWESLCVVLDAQQELNAARSAGDEALNATLSTLTMPHDAFELSQSLQKAGVPAAVAYKGSDLLEDPILEARKHFWPLHHAEMGTLKYNGPAYRFEKTPSNLRSASPRLGEHTEYVMRDILGFSDNEVETFRERGLLN